ncbi:MAG TPA: carboxypeptidase regulatory-like domain-containing protein, partial [Thermoplasmatales archaeon]|nr:carboxypeptidase regulatory-like domain-containing protein [Thermoplasmatales archaeon]HEX08779.1 carboxypeptidase regulatory-like domain-containing protein [Thermoplasmatales archaeon]
MGCKKEIRYRLKKRLMSTLIIIFLMSTSFAVITWTTTAATDGDNIKTYTQVDGQLIEKNIFSEEDFVIINVTVDNVSGDPQGPLYSVKAINENTGEWVWVDVTDNDTQGPWGTNNIPGDSIYWGGFEVNSSYPTTNSSGPGNLSILQVSSGDKINITEHYPGPFDNDTYIAYFVITIVSNVGNGTLCGFVKNNETGDAIPNATVLVNRTDGEPFSASVVTNESGFYIFDNNLSVGTYSVTASKEGPDGFPPQVRDNVTIGVNETIWENFSIDIGGPVGNGTVCGYVKDNKTGEPILDAVVCINRTDGIPFSSSVVTNESGFYIFDNNISAGIYDIFAYKEGEGGFPPWTVNSVEVVANETNWVNFSIDLGVPSGENTTIAGIVKNKETNQPLQNVMITIFKHGPEGFPPFETKTNQTGEFSVDVNETGPGEYEVQALLDGYIGYINWSVQVFDGKTTYLTILLTPKFEKPSYLVGRINSSSTGENLTDVMVVLLDTNFTHMLEDPANKTNNSKIVNGIPNCFNITITYNSTYKLILFKEGYYVKMETIPGIQEGKIIWYNVSLDKAKPDTLKMTVEFFDLDDARVTINRTLVAASPIVRFFLDFMPGIGNNNQIVDKKEIDSYLGMVNIFGPTLNVSLDKTQEPKKGEEERGPDFLATPVAIKLDGSYLNKYLAGSHKGTLDNILNTSIMSNETIYYNATFNITLDGPILNQISHPFNISTYYRDLMISNITFIFGKFYKITGITNETNNTILNTTNTLTMSPGNGSINKLAYANISLEFNTSTVSLPIVEVPTWHVQDKWVFNQTDNNGT